MASEHPMKKKHFIVAGLVMLSLPACVVVDPGIPSTEAAFAPLQRTDCEVSPEQVYLFFEGEPLDFTYRKIGVIEIRGRSGASLENMLDHVRYTAWKQCANGVIQLRKDYKAVEGEANTVDEDVEIRSDMIYSGIAVSIEPTPAFIDQYGSQPDTEFVFKTESRLQAEKQDTSINSGFAVSMLGLLMLLVLLVGASG
ncbi:MAG: hypothetical protein ACLFUB_21360 [Cyclobacteriaceae bacterium]